MRVVTMTYHVPHAEFDRAEFASAVVVTHLPEYVLCVEKLYEDPTDRFVYETSDHAMRLESTDLGDPDNTHLVRVEFAWA